MHVLGNPVKSIIESMEMGWLPSPPHVFNKLLDVCRDPDSSIAELADIIGSDAALTSKLIMAVNSAAFTSNQPINNLQQAISMVGHDQVKTMVLTSSIQQLFSGLVNSRKKTVCKLWLDSLYCATFAKSIAQALNYEQHQDAYLAGLLHDYGQIALEARFRDQYVDILNSKTEDEIVLKEISTFGVSHTDLGADILERWPSLNPAIADAARFHHESEQRLQGCDLLCQIVSEAGRAAWHWSHAGQADKKWNSTLLDDSDIDNIYIQVKDNMSRTASALGITFPGTGSLTHDQLSRDLEKATIKFGRKIRDASLINVINSEEHSSTLVNSPESLLIKIARELQIIFSIADVALLMPDSKNSDFLALYELNQASPLSKFPIDNNNSKMVRSFLEKSNFWTEPRDQHDDTTPVTDLQILRRLKHKIAFSVPLGFADQVIGVVIIGSHRAQKSYLASQSNFISGYLENIAECWLKNARALQQQAFENDTVRARDQKDIDNLLHEISNPLSVISNYIEIIRSQSKSDVSEIDKEITILKEEIQRISNIVLNFKDVRDSGSEPVWLNDELRICIPMYVKSFGQGKEVQVTWGLGGSDAEVNITRDALRQIILNLIKNAIEAQTENLVIVISSHHFVNIDGVIYAQFSVADRGSGVDANTRQLLFSPLNTTKSGTGRGLGLSIVAEILTQFNGQVKYLENEFGGASFEVLIPQSHKPSADQ